MSDLDITRRLNNELRLKWERTRDAEEKEGGKASTPSPPQITLTDVQYALKKSESSPAEGDVGSRGAGRRGSEGSGGSGYGYAPSGPAALGSVPEGSGVGALD